MHTLKVLFFSVFFAAFTTAVQAKTHEVSVEEIFRRTEQALILNQRQLNNAWKLIFHYKHCAWARQTLEMALPIAQKHKLTQNLEYIEAAFKTIAEMEEEGRCKN